MGNQLKPDIAAPGVNILAQGYGWLPGEGRHLGYGQVSGTSMAAPHVAGTAALILQMHPEWTPLQVNAAMENTALDFGYHRNVQGAGQVDALNAVTLNESQPTALILGIPEVTYR